MIQHLVFPMSAVEIMKLLSVILTREKQDSLDEELRKYGKATNWTIKQIMKRHLTTPAKTLEVLREPFAEEFDTREQYFQDVAKTARVEISNQRKLAKTIRSMRDKTPFFKPNRMILSQPLIRLSEKAVTISTLDGKKLAIPFDKRSRNRLIEKIQSILRGQKPGEINRKYGRIRITWNKEGFADIDVQTVISDGPRND